MNTKKFVGNYANKAKINTLRGGGIYFISSAINENLQQETFIKFYISNFDVKKKNP